MSLIYVPTTDKFALPLIGCTEYDLVDVEGPVILNTTFATMTYGASYASYASAQSLTGPIGWGGTFDPLQVGADGVLSAGNLGFTASNTANVVGDIGIPNSLDGNLYMAEFTLGGSPSGLVLSLGVVWGTTNTGVSLNSDAKLYAESGVGTIPLGSSGHAYVGGSQLGTKVTGTFNANDVWGIGLANSTVGSNVNAQLVLFQNGFALGGSFTVSPGALPDDVTYVPGINFYLFAGWAN